MTFWQAIVENLELGVGEFGCGGFRSDKTFEVTDMIPDLGVFGARGSPGKARRGGGSCWLVLHWPKGPSL